MPNDESFFFDRSKESKKSEDGSVRITMEGRVQKVGLRNWIKQRAVKMKVHGWVRNRTSGCVEAFFFGKDEDVREIVKLCHQGPSFAHIKKVKEFPESSTGNKPIEFTILPTV